MKNNLIKNIIIFVSVMSVFIFTKTEASLILIDSSSRDVFRKEQFYVDVVLDTEGSSINGVEGQIKFDQDKISFIRNEDGMSMVNLWIEKPKLITPGVINFAGIIQNGFNGVIDPFNPNQKLPGLIIRLVFEGKSEGISEIAGQGFMVALNDGVGTIEKIIPNNISINVKNEDKKSVYFGLKDGVPQLEVKIIKDFNLYNNKYVLIFDAKDEYVGIEKVMIKEGKRNWEIIESPYLLEDQTRHSIIYIQATNYSGASIIKTIDPIPYKYVSVSNILILIFVIIVLFLIFKKIYELKFKK